MKFVKLHRLQKWSSSETLDLYKEGTFILVELTGSTIEPKLIRLSAFADNLKEKFILVSGSLINGTIVVKESPSDIVKLVNDVVE